MDYSNIKEQLSLEQKIELAMAIMSDCENELMALGDDASTARLNTDDLTKDGRLRHQAAYYYESRSQANRACSSIRCVFRNWMAASDLEEFLTSWLNLARQHALQLTGVPAEVLARQVQEAQGGALALILHTSVDQKPVVIGCVQDTSESLAIDMLADQPSHLREFPSNETGELWQAGDYAGMSISGLISDLDDYLQKLPGKWKLVECDWCRGPGGEKAHQGECLKEVEQWLKEVN